MLTEKQIYKTQCEKEANYFIRPMLKCNISSKTWYFHVQENAAHERHVPCQLHQEPGEFHVDLFMLRRRKKGRHCDYRPEELGFAVRDQLLEKVPSQELQTKLFEVPNLQLAAASRPEHGKQHVV